MRIVRDERTIGYAMLGFWTLEVSMLVPITRLVLVSRDCAFGETLQDPTIIRSYNLQGVAYSCV